MQKILSQGNNYHQKNSTECECYDGVQTVIGIAENHLVEVNFTTEHLMEYIFSPGNLNNAYLQVKRNAGAGGVDKMEVEDILPYLRQHKDELIKSLMQGTYRPNPVRRVEIPKDDGKKRQLGIPSVVDRLIQQSISQVLTLIYDRTFSNSSFGFRPKRSCHNALRKMILCKSKRASNRTKESIIRFIEDALFLKVNREKTKTGYIQGLKFLGYSFYVMKGVCKLSLHSKSKAKLKSKLKELTSRSKGFGYERCKIKLKEYIQGWIGYYKLADMKSSLQSVDKWLRRRLRMCIWKCWKKVKTKFINLIKCKIDRNQAWQWANTRKSYWRTSKSPILQRALDKESLRTAGYPFLSDYYCKVYRN